MSLICNKRIAKNQLQLIIDIFGNPTEEEIEALPKEKFKKFLRSLPQKTPKSLQSLFPEANPLGKKSRSRNNEVISFGPT